MKRILCTLLGLGLCPGVAQARFQNNGPVDATIARASLTQQIENVSLQRSSPTGTITLTLEQAVRLALESNPALKVEKIRVEQARARIDGQKGEFNPLFNTGSTVAHRDNIVASRFYPTGFYTEFQKSQALSVEKRTLTGGRLSFSMNYAELLSSSNTQTLSPQHSTSLTLGFSHALLRDFGKTIGETRLRIAEKNATIAEGGLFVQISQTIQRVEEMYWTLTFLLKDLDLKKRSLDSAREFLAQNEALLRAGRVASVSVLQARAAVAEHERDLITAQAVAEEYEDRLKILLWLDLDATHLIPIDEPEENLSELDPQKSVADAIQRRPELQALQREVEQREIEVNFAANQRKPRLDFTAQYTASGLSGRPNSTCLDPTSDFCIPVGTNVAGSILADRTNFRDAFTPLLSANPFESWSVELKFQIPIGNQTANAQYSEASLRQLESQANLRALRDQVAAEVRKYIRDAQASHKRIDASREAVTYVEDQLAGMRQQLEAGIVSSYDVLKAFDEADRARTTELQATMEFNVALSKVRVADTSVFEKYNIELVGAPRYTFDRNPVR